MERARVWNKLISILIAIGVVWFFLFGIRLIGYFSAISERGIRATECGTQGCSDVVFILNLTWTLTFFIVIPLIIPTTLTFYFLIFKQRKS